jgi:hypothetical protein
LVERLLPQAGGVGDFKIQQEKSVQREAFDPSASSYQLELSMGLVLSVAYCPYGARKATEIGY